MILSFRESELKEGIDHGVLWRWVVEARGPAPAGFIPLRSRPMRGHHTQKSPKENETPPNRQHVTRKAQSHHAKAKRRFLEDLSF